MRALLRVDVLDANVQADIEPPPGDEEPAQQETVFELTEVPESPTSSRRGKRKGRTAPSSRASSESSILLGMREEVGVQTEDTTLDRNREWYEEWSADLDRSATPFSWLAPSRPSTAGARPHGATPSPPATRPQSARAGQPLMLASTEKFR